MAELITHLQELQNYPDELHLFCPRHGTNDESTYFDEDLHGHMEENEESKRIRNEKIKAAERRKTLFFDAIPLIAFDGPDAVPYQEWITKSLDSQMKSCDVCVRVFHRARAELEQKLEEQYDESTVASFLDRFDDMNITRITHGLKEALDELMEMPPEERVIHSLSHASLLSIFEALSCEAFLRNERLLSEFFDKPFDLVQRRRKLKLQAYVPALTYFIFSFNNLRYEWAAFLWPKMRRGPTRREFDWAIRRALFSAMKRVQTTAIEAEFLPRFWIGARAIVAQLDEDLITQSLRSMDINIYKLALDHCQLDFVTFNDLTGTIQHLLEKSPQAFWDSMNAIGALSPVVVAEQVLNSPSLKTVLNSVQEKDTVQYEVMAGVFRWIDPFLASLKSMMRALVGRTLVNAFMTRFQAGEFSHCVRSYCYTMGLKVIVQLLGLFNSREPAIQFVGTSAISEILDLVNEILPRLLKNSTTSMGLSFESEDSKLILDIIEQSLSLDCYGLEMERTSLLKHGALHHPMSAQLTPVWPVVVGSVGPRNTSIITRALQGVVGLVGLEKFKVKKGESLPSEWRLFNDTFDSRTGFVTQIFEKLGDFQPKDLYWTFESQQSATSIISPLLSSDSCTRQAALELLKVISSQDGRREALGDILRSFYHYFIYSLSLSIRKVARRKIFAPASSMIKLCTDVIDVLCNSQDGLLRARSLSNEDSKVTESFWQALWQSLSVIFETTETWSNMGNEKAMMADFCRDTMQFADRLFDQYSVFSSALGQNHLPIPSQDDTTSLSETGKRLLRFPNLSMNKMVAWLRLRDEYLSSKCVELINKLLRRLHEVSVGVQEEPLSYIEGILSGKIRAKLVGSQQAELQRSLELHTGHTLKGLDEESQKPLRAPKQGSLTKWITTANSTEDDGKAELNKLVKEITPAAEAFKAKLAARSKQPSLQPSTTVTTAEFKRKRELEKEAKKRRDALALAQARRATGGFHLAEVGSGLKGLGVVKDHSVKGAGLMLSSDESEEDEDELDKELFGLAKTSKKPLEKSRGINKAMIDLTPHGPVKKQRKIRSARDMRARLVPDLSSLHKDLLSWDYFHKEDFPPKSRTDMYNAVPDTFRTPNDYQATFRPLLTLEAWQGFVKAREENSFKSYEICIKNRSSVDAFCEVSSTMTHTDNKDLNMAEGDICLLSKGRNPAAAATEPHCLARVCKISRKKDFLEVLYRVMPGNPMIGSLTPGAAVYGVKIQSIIPLEREYGALLGLQYYDLCDEIIKAKPSPLLKYSQQQLDPILKNYRVNPAQAKAVKSAIDNDGFTLIQGPPGSGKTGTIVAIVGALLTDSFRDQGTAIPIPGRHSVAVPDAPPKKLLVCAPSNAAVDELVMRLKEGIKTLGGQSRKIKVVRLGRSEAINAAVQDVTLNQLVDAKLGMSSGQNDQREEIQKIFKEHQSVSEKLREAREKLDAGQTKGEEAVKLKEEFDALRRRKTQLGTAIDNARDRENALSRQTELNRRRAQQQVLDEADVICATLSGSGHEMFQGLNIEFEKVIVDEAAQCVEMSVLIPLKYGCAKCILVGDPKQLPPTVFSKDAARFQYEQSLFVRMQGNHPNDVHLLDIQYRMHPDISFFPSHAFYDGKLLDGPNMDTLRDRPWHHSHWALGPYRFFDVKGRHQTAIKGHSLINKAEVSAALQLYKDVTTRFKNYEFDFTGKIGIITPYKSQLRELKDTFAREFSKAVFDHVEFNTTDAFQGRECEIIIFSCVRASPTGGIGFLQDIRRMNVGLTRAKSSLWVLGNSSSLIRGEFWKKLVDDAKRRGVYLESQENGTLPITLRKGLNSHNRPRPLIATVESNTKTESLPSRSQQSTKVGPSSVLSLERANLIPSSERKFSDLETRDTVMKDAPAMAESSSDLTSGVNMDQDQIGAEKGVPRKENASSGEPTPHPLLITKVELKDEPKSGPGVVSRAQAASLRQRPPPVHRKRRDANPLLAPNRPKKPRPT